MKSTLIKGKLQPGPSRKEMALRYFTYEHLSTRLQLVSKPFCRLAESIFDNTIENPQLDIALQKLLEAQDAAVRASLFK